MIIEDVEGHLGHRHIVPLRCLLPNHDMYQMLVLQPDGPIIGTPVRVGHEDSARGHALVRVFLNQAREHAAEIAITPEYSTPWTILTEIAQTELRPEPGQVWVLGCESLARERLDATVAALRDAGCFVVHEPLAAAEGFLDTVAYLFWTREANDASTLAVVLQFKTIASADDMEHRALVCGTLVYRINCGINSIALTTLICSDVFELSEPQIAEFTNTLLLHIQLNPKPANEHYKRYRDHLARVTGNRDVHVVCLNWAGNLLEHKTDGSRKRWRNNAGSALYVPPHKFACSQDLIEDAHRKGLYYSRVGQWHGYYLDQQPHMLLLQLEKVHEHNVPSVLQRNSLVQVVGRWTWNAQFDLALSLDADSGYAQLAAAHYVAAYDALRDLVRASPIAAERVLELLFGRVTAANWYEVQNMRSLEVASSESLQRSTVHQDHNADSAGVAFRKATWQRAQDAITLPGQDVPWPKPLARAASGFVFSWQKEFPHYNITLTDNGGRASLVYLGETADEESVKTKHGQLLAATRSWLATQAANEDAFVTAGDRICIVYRKDHVFRVWGAGETSRIDNVIGAGPFDITGA